MSTSANSTTKQDWWPIIFAALASVVLYSVASALYYGPLGTGVSAGVGALIGGSSYRAVARRPSWQKALSLAVLLVGLGVIASVVL